ncbi:hypothetical protein [Euzebya sp.]|uniref:hypothetical protein n=1 Tax=Euzebya sp. TaxID=1971409 RepID=UPI003514C912
MNANDIAAAVRRLYGCETDDIGPEWAALAEMDLQPGHSTRRIDLLLVRAWRGKRGHERVAVEIKVSRSDLRRELASRKWMPWADVVHRFILAVPAAMSLDGFGLPERWGVITVDDDGTAHHTRPSVRVADCHDLPETAWIEAFRRASRLEARLRAPDDPRAQVVALASDVARLERSLTTARAAADRERSRLDDALELISRVHPAVSCECGTPLTGRRGRGLHLRWEHDGDPGPDPLDANRICSWPRVDLDVLADATLPDTEQLLENHGRALRDVIARA